MSAFDAAALDAFLRERAAADAFSGVVLVEQDGARLFGGAYGFAVRAWRVPNTLDTRFDSASVTKLFTAVAVLQQVERGALALETRVVETLGLTGTTIAPDVTVFHLLTHTSGIGDDADEEAGESYEDVWKTRPNYSVTETSDFLPQFIHKPPNFPPGQGCRYNNVAFVLLGLLVERASGDSYRQYVQREVFARAGMTRSGFFRMDRVEADVAEGCDPLRDESGALTGWKRNIYAYPPVGSPDGGAHVTAGDLARFLRAAQTPGVLLSDPQAFLTPRVLYRESPERVVKFGFGLEFVLGPNGNVRYYQKDGINAGVSALLRHYPAQRITAVLLSNLMDGVWEPAQRVHQLLGG